MGLGMVHIVGHGLSGQDIMRQFAAGSVFFDGVSEQEKKQRVGRIAEEGNWAGYKVRYPALSQAHRHKLIACMNSHKATTALMTVTK